jgi:predicted RND superfamily exporter protein
VGFSLNIYSQIGIILLIGLMAKNGILIVEFANQLRDEGQSVREAVIDASVLRLRPIVMTIVSTVLGAVPLVLATGAGAESRAAIGTVIIGGLLFAGVLTLFLTPVLYDLMARFTRRAALSRRSWPKSWRRNRQNLKRRNRMRRPSPVASASPTRTQRRLPPSRRETCTQDQSAPAHGRGTAATVVEGFRPTTARLPRTSPS